MLTRNLVVGCMVVTLVGCTGTIGIPGWLDEPEPAELVLEGDELAAELINSFTREAEAPFVRLGAIWDAPVGARIEVATSADGMEWSQWSELRVVDVQVEDSASFVGTHELDEPALYYRLRSSGGELPTFLNMQFLELDFAEVIEDGVDPNADGVGSTTQALTVGGASVIDRASWGAQAPRCISYHSPNRFTVHHTATPTNDSISAAARVRQIQSYHRDVRGWCDIGYQYLVSRDGRLWEGRGAARNGAHVAGNNTGNIGLSFIGTHDSTNVTDTQLTNAAELVRGLADQYGISVSAATLKGHRDYGGSSCPGDALYGQLPTLRALANSDTPPPEPEPEPDPDPPAAGGTVKGVVYVGNDTSERLANATVKLGTRTTTSNSVGYFEFAGIPAGNVTVTAAAGGYDSASVTRAASGATSWASVGLWPTAATGSAVLQGVVYRGSNSLDRIPYATVTLSNGTSVNCSASGYYKVENQAPGTVTITASAPGYASDSVQRTLVNGTTEWGSVSL